MGEGGGLRAAHSKACCTKGTPKGTAAECSTQLPASANMFPLHLCNPAAAEDELRASGVPFAIVRPTALTEEAGGMPLVVEQGDTLKGKVSREVSTAGDKRRLTCCLGVEKVAGWTAAVCVVRVAAWPAVHHAALARTHNMHCRLPALPCAGRGRAVRGAA